VHEVLHEFPETIRENRRANNLFEEAKIDQEEGLFVPLSIRTGPARPAECEDGRVMVASAVRNSRIGANPL
jgi:hypothetical protein